MAIAQCGPNGVIQFNRRLLKGKLPIASGDLRKLRTRMETVARHGYQKGVLLVPGLPEADSQDQAFAALKAFLAWIKPGCEKIGLAVAMSAE